MAATDATHTKLCPNCGADMSVYRDFVTWCEKCDWGLEGDAKEEKQKSRLEKLYDHLGKQQGRVIFEKIREEKNLKPVWSKTRILIFFLAGVVHLISIALVFAGLLLLISRWEYPFIVILAILLLGLAWLLRPRPAPDPKENVLSRKEFPAIYTLVDQISTSLGTRVDQIVISEWFTASFGHTGWKQKNTLTLGFPLWEILADQERVALIAHEMAHAVNGDASRSMFVGTAIQSLITWYKIIEPGPIIPAGMNFIGLLGIPFRLIAALVAGMIWGFIRLLTILLFRDMQRAEYLADRLGANTAGREAFAGLLRQMFHNDSFMLAVQHCALNSQKPDFYKEMHELIENTPQSELERIRRLENRDMIRLDATHPPTGLRIKMLQDQPMQAPAITADPETFGAIDQQFTKYRVKIQARLVEHYRAAITY